MNGLYFEENIHSNFVESNATYDHTQAQSRLKERGNMLKKYFPKVEKTIPYEGRDSKNPLTFKFYNKDQKISNKTITLMITLKQNGLGSPRINFNVAVRHSFHKTINHFCVPMSRRDIFSYQS